MQQLTEWCRKRKELDFAIAQLEKYGKQYSIMTMKKKEQNGTMKEFYALMV